jgi:pimeloyl-ACP methyl ester carboxylesterase
VNGRRIAAVAAGTAAVAGLATAVAIKRSFDRTRREADPHAADDLAWPDDVREHTVASSDGGTIHVVDRGDERRQPVVFVHGIGLQARLWRYQFDDLVDRFRVIAVDARGHGRSVAGREGYGLSRVADDLAAVLSHVDARDAIVVGHSMGGMALMRFCAEHRDVLDERVAGLVFVATSPGFPLAAITQRVGPAAVAAGERIGWRVPSFRFPEHEVTSALVRQGFGRHPSPTHIELTRQLLAEAAPAALYPSGFHMVGHDARRALATTHTPSLVVVGDCDRLTPVRAARRIARHLPDSRLEVLPGCGHQVMLERREELAKLLIEFADEIALTRAH